MVFPKMYVHGGMCWHVETHIILHYLLSKAVILLGLSVGIFRILSLQAISLPKYETHIDIRFYIIVRNHASKDVTSLKKWIDQPIYIEGAPLR